LTVELHIFDLDGVITNTAVVHQKAWEKTANDINRNHNINKVLDFGRAYYLDKIDGKSRAGGLQAILLDLGICLDETSFNHYMSLKEKFFFDELKQLNSREIIFQDAFEYLNHLKSLPDIVITLATSSLNGRKIASAVGISDYFNYIADGSTLLEFGFNGKPSPDIFNHVIEQYVDRKTSSIVVYEDSRSGIEAALRSNATDVYHVKRLNRCKLEVSVDFNCIFKLQTINTLEELILK